MAPLMNTTVLGFILLSANSLIAIRKSWGSDAVATVFVIASHASLVLLFWFLRLFETATPGSPARDRAKVGVWLTTTLLTAMFSWRVAVLLPWWPVGAGVCFMGASTVAGGFYALFLLLPSSCSQDTTTEDC